VPFGLVPARTPPQVAAADALARVPRTETPAQRRALLPEADEAIASRLSLDSVVRRVTRSCLSQKERCAEDARAFCGVTAAPWKRSRLGAEYRRTGRGGRMHELFPIASGLLLGAVLPLIRPHMRLKVGVGASVVLGTLATIISGEYEIGWEFLVIDVPLVALCSVTGFATARAVRRRLATAQGT